MVFILRRERKALVPVLEFILVFIIFLFIMSAFYSALSTQFPKVDTQDAENREDAMDISDTLIRNTGLLSNKDRNWESYYARNFNFGHNHIILIGLARDPDSRGVLSWEKIEKMPYMDQSTVRDAFQLDQGQLVNVSFTNVNDDDTVFTWGGSTNAKTSHLAIVKRFVQVDMGNGEMVPMIMTVKVFNGGSSPQTVYVEQP